MTTVMPRRTHNAIDISKYIICVAQSNGDTITNLKLQKLLYYAQAWFLVNNDNTKLFDDDIVAWQYGPVVVSVYEEFKSFGRAPIDIACDLDRDFSDLCNKVKEYLNEFCETFLSYSATELVAITHQEEPWLEAIAKGYGTVINTETMYKFYTKMLDNE